MKKLLLLGLLGVVFLSFFGCKEKGGASNIEYSERSCEVLFTNNFKYEAMFFINRKFVVDLKPGKQKKVELYSYFSTFPEKYIMDDIINNFTEVRVSYIVNKDVENPFVDIKTSFIFKRNNEYQVTAQSNGDLTVIRL